MSEPILREEILSYEVRASWWASWAPEWAWLREAAARYFAWKVRRKHRRYMDSLCGREALERLKRKMGLK